MTSEKIEQGEYAVCDWCRRARPITKPVVSLFGYRIGFGPGGEHDMFSEKDGEVVCYSCIDDEELELYVEHQHENMGETDNVI